MLTAYFKSPVSALSSESSGRCEGFWEGAIVGTLSVLSPGFSEGAIEGVVEVYYLDVGQGDCSLIRINNKTVLIDTGGKVEYDKEEWQRRNHNYNIIISKLKQVIES